MGVVWHLIYKMKILCLILLIYLELKVLDDINVVTTVPASWLEVCMHLAGYWNIQ